MSPSEGPPHLLLPLSPLFFTGVVPNKLLVCLPLLCFAEHPRIGIRGPNGSPLGWQGVPNLEWYVGCG